MTAPTPFTVTELFTDHDGRARFRDHTLSLDEGTPVSRLTRLAASGGCQWRESPAGFASSFHCTGEPQWLIVLQGQMEIGLQDGSTRVFGPGQVFYSNDTLPEGAVFDDRVHGHRSRLLGEQPLRTLFVRTREPGF
ncbi:hypothetical protein CCO03_07605 [Comamonas serinivorans]|uniref:Cupin n=1 Tax=Comamonas serinivorans TaxID=1082851 RepID=A0A1Y0EMB4_9BURK|nr:hypothetical protein [Comamonas serinivorans]ARU04560.1 hypothetical protein CCO03_07605 [Comamonas serinivorans]